MDILIDTSVFVAWEREGRTTTLPHDTNVALSAVTASELLHGVHRANTAQRRYRRQQWVDAILSTIVIIPVDINVARVHARIWADLKAAGTPIGAHDLLIGATALAHGASLATRDEGDFQRIDGLDVIRW